MTATLEPDTTILAIVGPTAVGKTRVALRIAPEMGAEIISVDSMQVYRGMDIGTSKPGPEDRERVRFHLLDAVDPAENYSAARYKEMADQAIADVVARGKRPLLVGGSGLYFRAVVDDLDFANIGGAELYRAEVEEELEDMKTPELYELLRELDPRSADGIPPTNRRRLLRAIQAARGGDRLMSERQPSWSDFESPYDIWPVALQVERALLYRLIDLRVDAMMQAGLEDEVKALAAKGLKKGTTAGEALGYRQLLDLLDGNCTIDEAVDRIKKKTRNYAKRQLTWFKKDPRIKWFTIDGDVDDPLEDVERAIDETGRQVLDYFREYL
jgi:tRNA dimethylallyltransferase